MKIRKLKNGEMTVVMVKAEDSTRGGMHEVGALNLILWLFALRNALAFDTSVKSSNLQLICLDHPICFQKQNACRDAQKWLFLCEVMRWVSSLRIMETFP